MNFNSVAFFIFLGITLMLHHILPWRFGRLVLLFASYFFYGFETPWYCILLFSTTFIDFLVAIWIARTATQRSKFLLLLISLVTNLGMLGFFKYGDFTISNANSVLGWFGTGSFPLLHLILPAGISFYTFQTLSYTIDVYRGKIAPTRDFAHFALYVSFFPQLVAGPIERATNLIPQLAGKQPVTATDIETGFQRILWGLVKKLVFADRLGIMVDEVYASPSGASAPVLLIAAVSFTCQIYLDFSAYTDIAIGVARLMGVRLSENFNWPLLSKNPSDFWSRWHMTLTTWFRDYVYKPLGGTMRSRPARTFITLVFVMTLVGIWHGASWNFVLFGFSAGLSVALYHRLRLLFARKGSRGPLFGNRWWSSPLAYVLTFSFNVLTLGILFRSRSLEAVREILTGIGSNNWQWEQRYSLQLLLILVVLVIHIYRGLYMSDRRVIALSSPVRALFWVFLSCLIIFGSVEHTERFIYFEF